MFILLEMLVMIISIFAVTLTSLQSKRTLYLWFDEKTIGFTERLHMGYVNHNGKLIFSLQYLMLFVYVSIKIINHKHPPYSLTGARCISL